MLILIIIYLYSADSLVNMNSEVQPPLVVNSNRGWGLACHSLSKSPFNVKGGSLISNKYVMI